MQHSTHCGRERGLLLGRHTNPASPKLHLLTQPCIHHCYVLLSHFLHPCRNILM
jgi:hypothetical protein